MSKPRAKPDTDCTGLGKWFFWIILGIVVIAWAVMAFKAKGQGLLGGATSAASVDQRSTTGPGITLPPPGPEGCEGDTGPTVILSDCIIVTTTLVTGGAGTEASPLTLTEALLGTGIMATTSKRIVLVHGGTYNAISGGYKCRLAGTAGSPWLVRNYPGESPRIHGFNGASAAARCLHLGDVSSPTPKFLTIRGLRFHNPTLSKSLAGHDIQSAGIKIDRGNDVTIEHCIIDNNFGVGLDHGSTWTGPLTLKHNLCMLNGSTSGTHGAYVHSWADFTNIIDGNIMINNSGYALHCYSSHNYISDPNINVNNQKITRNILRKSSFLHSGGALAVWRNDTTEGNPGNLRQDAGTGNVVINNVCSSSSDSGSHRMDNNIGMIVKSNYFQRGFMTWRHNWQNNVFEDNRRVSGAGAGLGMRIGESGQPGPSTIDGFVLNNNVYNFYGSSTAWQFLAVNKTFADWKTATGQDAASTGNTTNPTDTTKFIFQSTVDTNVIHFAIMNEGASATQTIDFSGYWPACGTITIRNAGDYDATPVVNNVAYTGQTFTLSMTGQTYPDAIGGGSGTMSPSAEFFAGIAVRTPANPNLTDP